MLAWLQLYGPTILICGALVLLFALLVRSLIRNRKSGKSSCCGGCGGCSGCAMAGHCHPAADKENGENARGSAP